MFKCFLLYVIITLKQNVVSPEDVCSLETNSCPSSNVRYLMYDINPPEGFNLRRDVYIRFAVLANKLKSLKNQNLDGFNLVLPPWSHLYHWTYSEEPEYVPWGYYFDLDSMKKFAPVVEMHEFLNGYTEDNKYSKKVIIDEVHTLQHFEDMFKTGHFENKMEIDKCLKNYPIHFFYYNNFTSKSIKCLSFHGSAGDLSNLLTKTNARSVLINHAEVALHDHFGDKTYWEARRSMRFNKDLVLLGQKFRKKFLNSTDETDNTQRPADWTKEKPHRTSKGGPYLAVHIRRGDFSKGRANQVPSMKSMATQIVESLKFNGLDTVFIATDASDEELEVLMDHIPEEYVIMSWDPTEEFLEKYKDGGAAIVDQIICSYARYFIGTHESTFSFRIQEEREILGFPVSSTFNVFCKDVKNCEKPSIWKIVYK